MWPKSDWAGLIPHQGTMCLLDVVRDWDTTQILALSDSHRRPDHPLRGGAGLRALHLCEYGAQTMAVHGALLARAAGTPARPGLLVALRDVGLFVQRIDDLPGSLEIGAERLLDTGTSWQYRFHVRHAGTLLAEGRATVMLGDASPGASPPRSSP